MQTSVWLRITGKKKYTRWEIGKVETFQKNKPACSASQIAVKLTLEIPDNIFDDNHYEFKAKIPTAPKSLIEPVELGKEVMEALSKKLGMKVKLDLHTEDGTEIAKPMKRGKFAEELKDL